MTEIKIEDLDLLKIGNGLQLGGFILGDANTTIIVAMPNEDINMETPYVLLPTQEEFDVIMRQMDLQETEIIDSKTGKKAIVRKSQRKTDTFVNWRVFRRDEFTCRYCGRNDIPLTYDHVKTWETGGEWSIENGITACRKCNKTRSNMDFALWLKTDYVQELLPNVPEHLIQMNIRVLENYKNFPERKSKRSR